MEIRKPQHQQLVCGQGVGEAEPQHHLQLNHVNPSWNVCTYTTEPFLKESNNTKMWQVTWGKKVLHWIFLGINP